MVPSYHVISLACITLGVKKKKNPHLWNFLVISANLVLIKYQLFRKSPINKPFRKIKTWKKKNQIEPLFIYFFTKGVVHASLTSVDKIVKFTKSRYPPTTSSLQDIQTTNLDLGF